MFIDGSMYALLGIELIIDYIGHAVSSFCLSHLYSYLRLRISPYVSIQATYINVHSSHFDLHSWELKSKLHQNYMVLLLFVRGLPSWLCVSPGNENLATTFA
jgi:hypothetical protein